MKSKWFVRGDVDGFFGLFFDNLTNLMLIAVLGTSVCGFPAELLAGRILPGVAVSASWWATCSTPGRQGG